MTTTKPNSMIRCDMEQTLNHYFSSLEGHEPRALYAWVHDQIDQALLKIAMERSEHNQTKVARFLGMSRTTLRKKLKQCALSPQ